MEQKIKIADILKYPSKTEVLADTPATGDTTVYTAYVNPTKNGNLDEVVIKKDVILANAPSTNDTDITQTWACTSSAVNDQLEFNKRWSLHATYDYKLISY